MGTYLAIEQQRIVLRFILMSVFFSTTLGIPAFCQAKVKLVPTLTLDESWSDNVNQDTTGKEETSFITSVSPGIALKDKTANSDYHLNYRYYYHRYSNPGFEGRDENTLSAALNHYELDRTLRLFVNGNIFNSRLQPGSFSDGITGSKQVETQTAAAGIQYSSGQRNWHNTSFGTDYRRTHTDNDLSDINIYSANFATANGKQAQNLNWRFNGAGTYDSEKSKNQLISGTIGIKLADNYSFVVLGQYEYAAPNGDSAKDFEFSSWGLGFRRSTQKSAIGVSLNREETGGDDEFIGVDFLWTPTARTAVSGFYSNRFFGETYQFQLSHKTRKIANSIAYKDSVTSFGQQSLSSGLGFLVCPEGTSVDFSACFVPTDPDAVLEDGQQLVSIDMPLLDVSKDQVLVRSLIHSTQYTSSKTTLNLNTHWHRTKSLKSGALNNKNYDREFGGALSWGWELGSRTRFQMSGGWNKFERNINLASEETVKEIYSRAILTRQFSRKITGSISYTFNKQNSSVTENSFDENRVGFSALARF